MIKKSFAIIDSQRSQLSTTIQTNKLHIHPQFPRKKIKNLKMSYRN